MIKRLLHIEQIKLLNYNPFRITLGIYFLAFSLGLLIYPAVDKEIPVISLSDLFRFPDGCFLPGSRSPTTSCWHW